MGRDDVAVGQQFTGVIENHDAITEQAPSLLGVGRDDLRGLAVRCVR